MATNDSSVRIHSLAFPAIGCGLSGCNSRFVAKTLIRAVTYEFEHQRSLRFDVYFVIRRSEQNIFDAFRTEITKPENRRAHIPRLPYVSPHPPVKNPLPYNNGKEFVVEKRLLYPSSNDHTMVLKELGLVDNVEKENVE